MLRIVRIIIYCSHCSRLVETESQHTFVIKVGKPERPDHRIHAVFASPLSNGVKQSFGNFVIVNKVNKSETHILQSCTAVNQPVYNTGYAAHRFAVAICHPRLRLTVFKCRVLFRIKSGHIIHYQWRHVAVIILIKAYSKFSIMTQLFLFRCYFAYFYCHLTNDGCKIL